MALSTLSRAMRPCLFGQRSALKLLRPSMPMATTADEEMRKYWEKNQRLNRPNSPWLVYKPQLSMWSSLAHRVTGVGLGLALYGAAVGMAVAPGDISVYMEAVKGLELGPAVWFPTKVFCSFPIFYHSLNGIRHLYWDFKGGYEVREQNKSAIVIFSASLVMSMILSAAPYLIRAMRPCLFGQRSILKLARPSMPMATTADDEMRKYWEKNQRLGRPNSPWLIYRWPVTMAASFAHRVTGVGLGVGLYIASIGMAVAPGDFAVYLDYLKALELGPAVWFPIKMFCSFPIFYHCLSGIRHLYWDFKGGYEMREQTKSAYLIWGTAIASAITVASAAYVF